MRRLILASLLSVSCGAAHAQLLNNPFVFPSAPLVTGNCIQATGPNSFATTPNPCGSGSGTGGIKGPTSSTIGHVVGWGDGTGTSVVDTGVVAANIPQLGASQTWGGLNTYVATPVFPTAAPGDNSNQGATTNFVATLAANYLTTASAAATYLTIANAASTYLTAANATATYLTIANAASTYETKAAAASTFATIAALNGYVPLTGGVSTGVQTAPGYTLDAPAGTWKPISFNAAGKQRWQLGANNTGEGGNNTGADFDLFSYTDAGAVLQNVVHIPRATGIAAFVARPTFNGNLAWDAGNLDPTTFATSASLAAALVPYLKSADAANTYTTPAEVNAALALFETKADAAATYCALAGCTLASLNVTGAAMGVTPTAGNNSTNFATTAFVNTALVPYLTNATAAATYATIAGVQSAYLRITDAASTYLTIANAASTYLTIANAAATYLTPAQGDARYIRTTGAGTPYDIAIPFTGVLTSPSPRPLPTGYHILYYQFVRKVVIPVGFVGSAVEPLVPATANASLGITSTGTAGGIGELNCAAGATKCIFATVGGPFTFLPGDVLAVTTDSVTQDPTLAGLFGGIQGSISP